MGGQHGLFKKRASKLSIRDRYLKGLLRNVQHRCTNPRDKRFKDYGGRGIECCITFDDLKILYERDRPDLMVRPSIDRKENDEHYDLENCRFLEMIDNTKRAKRRPYACEVCGVVAMPRKANKKRLCEPCAISEKFRTNRFPRYVRAVIDDVRKQGFIVEGVRIGNVLTPLNTTLKINGFRVKIHIASHATQTSPGSSWYWHFTARVKADFHCLVGSRDGKYRIWVCPHDVTKPSGFYVPIKYRPVYNNNPPKVDWQQYENAWHLLAPAEERKAS